MDQVMKVVAQKGTVLKWKADLLATDLIPKVTMKKKYTKLFRIMCSRQLTMLYMIYTLVSYCHLRNNTNYEN